MNGSGRVQLYSLLRLGKVSALSQVRRMAGYHYFYGARALDGYTYGGLATEESLEPSTRHVDPVLEFKVYLGHI